MNRFLFVVAGMAVLIAALAIPVLADQEICLDSLTTDEYFRLTGGKIDESPYVGRWVNPYGCDESVVSSSAVQLDDGTIRLSLLVVPFPDGCNPIFIETMAGDQDFNLSGQWYNAPFTGENGSGGEQFMRIDCSLVPSSNSTAKASVESRYTKAEKAAKVDKKR